MSHKQVIVMRKDLGMRKGKMIAQGAHAALKAILDLAYHRQRVIYDKDQPSDPGDLIVPLDERSAPWLQSNFKKVCVYVTSEAELDRLYEQARRAGMICSMIVDSGLTEFGGVPTKTCIAIGPDFEAKVDEITGHLPLL
jgi:PTH2 family peptidyl-tRNA hydrolase